MKLQKPSLRTLLTATAAAATLLAVGLPTAAQAQAKYKDEYRMSLVLGTAFPGDKAASCGPIRCASAPTGASTSSSTPAPRWCRATRRVSSRRCARA